MSFFLLLYTLNDEERSYVEQLYVAHRKSMYNLAYSILHRQHDAEDAVDKAMENIINNIQGFVSANEDEIAARISIYTRYAAINLYNKNKRHWKNEKNITYLNDENQNEENDIEDKDMNLDEIVFNNETVEIVKKYISQLPQIYQDVISLVYGMGHSNVEAAKVLKITPNAVGMRIRKAKKKLMEMAGSELYERYK